MKNIDRPYYTSVLRLFLSVLVVSSSLLALGQEPPDSNDVNLPFPIYNPLDPTQNNPQNFDLGDPKNMQRTIVFDPQTGKYIFQETLGGGLMYRYPSMMTLEEYLEYERQKSLKENWKDKIDQQTEEDRALEFPFHIPSKTFENFFGSDEITIRPQGSVEVSFGVNSSRYDNPMLPVKQRVITRFDFQQQIQMNLVGQIGTKLKLNTSYNTQAAFDFDNITKLGYSGDEDQIMQRIELGNVSFPSFGSLIPGSQTLFGAYAKLRTGRLTTDVIMAQSKGKKTEIKISGKAQVMPFEFGADSYEANRHYFVNLFFHDQYNQSMSQLPNVASETFVTRMEVWVTNRINSTDNARNIIAFSDLGESNPDNCEGTPAPFSSDPLPDNESNGIYNWAANNAGVRGFNTAVSELSAQNSAPGPFQQAIHYEKVENARKLSESEFSYNALLGFISLSQPLNNDEVLAVAYEYTYRGKTYQVGEFSTDGVDGRNTLLLKLLKPTITNPTLSIWDLMMKNVYSIGAYQLDENGFQMNIYYNNPSTSVLAPIFPYDALKETQIITLIGMDRYNVNDQQFSDGMFDFIPMSYNGPRAETGGTINPKNGRVYFSTIEPFGRTLRDKMLAEGIPETEVDRIAYTELYDSTKTAAQQIPSKNRFLFKGQYQSSVTSDIPLNALNVPEGAVKVTVGGIALVEGQDYTVDYNLGRVKILNTGLLESNADIKITIESNSVFGFQSKSMIGTHFNYRFNKDFNVGATWMRMMERPVTQKVDIGSEPYKNNVIGFDVNYKADLPWLTKAIDFLPVISTKEKSYMTFKGEFATLIPGTPRAISKEGISYVDDFEGSQSTIDLRNPSGWKLAATPQGQMDLFPEGNLKTLANGYKRSKLAWYTIDNLFYMNNDLTPQHIKDDPSMLSDSRMRLVQQSDIFPNQNLPYGSIPTIQTLDLAYYPLERGMYNYDTTNTVNADGTFTNPEDRWGGVTRALTTNDFELANVQYIQFWMLDPFNEDAENQNPNTFMTGGDLYFNLGNISEDVLADSRKSFENGIPPYDGADYPTDQTPWAEVPNQQMIVNAFADQTSESRIRQDVGLDGRTNAEEATSYTNYVNWVNSNGSLSPEAKARMIADPSTDDYNFYRDDDYDLAELNILQRYKRFNNHQGNTATTEMSDTMNQDKYVTQGSFMPDNEDINQDNNLSETEAYYQYHVSLRPNDMVVGKNYIVSEQVFQIAGSTKQETWYQFKIPIHEPEKAINGIRDFRSIRFMRMFLKEFNEEVVVRFAKLEFIRGEWRPYLLDLTTPGEGIFVDPNLTAFTIGALNYEENAQKQPIGYQIPPGIQREIDPSQPVQRQMNEQSLTLDVCDLQDGDARAAYRNVNFDVRTYKKLKMFVHAEEITQGTLSDKDVTLFVRLGTDFVDNYYEYELPLYKTAWGNSSPEGVWPTANDMEIIFQDLLDLKMRRNELAGSGSSGVSTTLEYSIPDPRNADRLIKVKGSPNLQGIKTLMIGIRNPSKSGLDPWPDDGLQKCVQVWVNELRLTDFVDDGGSAAIAQMQIQAADFMNMSISSNYSGVNWGAVDSRVQERQRNQKFGYDYQSTVQLGQFFGSRAKVTLPLFYGQSIGIINPEYDPFNPDIKLKAYDPATRRSIARIAQDYTERKFYNFQGVRINVNGKKPNFYDISNWTFGYGYSENLHRDFNTNYDRTKQWKGNLAYAYTFTGKPFEPFKDVKFMKKSPWWALVRETNLSLLPKNVSFTNDILRTYNERQIRNTIDTSAGAFQYTPVYVKNFTWNRNYKVGWDFTKNLKFTFNATNRAIFDEGNGEVNRRGNDSLYREFKDTVFTQLRTLGKTMDYTHDYSFTYNLPFSKIPVLTFLTGNVKYSGTYNWQRAPLGQEEYGNIIQNSRTINGQLQANFLTLYNKVPLLKRINGSTQGTGRAKINDAKGLTEENDKGGANTKTPDKPSAELKPPKPLEEMTPKERRKWEREKRKHDRQQKRKEKEKEKVNPVLGFAGRLLMTVRTVSGTYAQTDGTLLPGYNQESRVMGYNPSFAGDFTGFLFGQQSYSITGKETGYHIGQLASGNGWMVANPMINRQHTVTHSQTITGRGTLEPFKDFTIDLSLNRNMTQNTNDFYRYNDVSEQFESQSLYRTSTLTYSTISIGTAFEKLGQGYASQNFQNMVSRTEEVSAYYGSQNANSVGTVDGYASGYGRTQQEVLIGSFLSSYTSNKVSERSTNPFSSLPLPNWTINYNGLTKFPFMKDRVKNFVIRHGYTSTVSLAGVQSNLNSTVDGNGNYNARDLNDNFIAANNVQAVTISERFSPLIGFDATWNINKQGLITKFEIKKDRSATLSLNNNQVTEVLGNEIVIGTGYKFAKVRFPFKINQIKPENPLNIRFDFTFRDNLTVIRKVVEGTTQATAGQRVVSIKSSVDYNVTNNLILQFYYDQVITTPKISTSYPTGNLSTGIRLRFNLGGL